MAYASISLNPGDKAVAEVLDGPGGHWILVRVSGALTVYLPGNDGDAVVNARQWATALTEAADQIVAKLEHESIAEVV